MKITILLFSVATFFVVAYAYKTEDDPNKSKLPTNLEEMKKHFEKLMGKDNLLSLKEFKSMCRDMFRNDKDHIYVVPDDQIKQLFNVFDKDHNESIDHKEFGFCWHNWISKTMKPKIALVVVDAQNDFITGSLNIHKINPNQNGNDIIAPINNLLDTVNFHTVVYSQDWHPKEHISFIDSIKNKNKKDKTGLWPEHCVQGTWGAELHKDLKRKDGAIILRKGHNPDIDSYSVFWDNERVSQTTLDAELKSRGVTGIMWTGIATDVCVAHSAKDGMDLGYQTFLVDDCCRGVVDENIKKTEQEIVSNNGAVIISKEVKAIVEGLDRRPEPAFKLAQDIKNGKIKPEN